MDVIVMCPNLSCRTALRLPENVRGKKVRCGECGTVFTVPDKPKPAKPSRRAHD